MHKMPHNDFSDRKGVPEGQNDDQLGPSHQGQPRATILAIYGRAVGDRARVHERIQKLIRILRSTVLHLEIERPSNIPYKPG